MQFNNRLMGMATLAVIIVLAIVGCAPAPVEAPAQGETVQQESDAGTSDDADDGSKLPLPDGACANALFPLELGNQWVYVLDPDDELLESSDPDLSDIDTFTWTVVDVTETQATLEISSDDPVFNASYTVECDQGAILTFPSVSLDLALGGGEFGSADLRYERGSGLFLPSAQTLEDNNWDYGWETVLLLSGEIRTVIDDTQEFLAVMQESPFFFDWSTAGSGEAAFETIEVLAGEFEALKLDLETNIIFNIDMAGSTFAAEFITDENQWYAPGVGLLQTSNNTATMELSGMSLPMEDTGSDISLMLIEFRPGADS